MKANVIFFTLMTTAGILSCTSIKESRYSKYNEFRYTKQQPTIHFKNDKLNIQGEWFWASGARVMPKASFMPKIPYRILRSVAKRHSAVLFATWIPNWRKYSTDEFVPVTKKDVRLRHKYYNEFFMTVLINEGSLDVDTAKYKPYGRTNDYQFAVFASEPERVSNTLWAMQVIAKGKKRNYSFVCILDSAYMKESSQRNWQAERFLEDVKLHFGTQEWFL